MKLTKFVTEVAASALFALAAGSAHADTYQFTVSGDYSASWQLDSSLVDLGVTNYDIAFLDTPGFADASTGVADVYFFNSGFDGGLEIDDFNGATALLSATGPQLYTGNEAGTITFLTGSFTLAEFGGSGAYTLTISDVTPAAVPEPASVAMLLAGLGTVSALARRRRRQA